MIWRRRWHTSKHVQLSLFRNFRSPRCKGYTLICLPPEPANVWLNHTPLNITKYCSDTLGSTNSEHFYAQGLLAVDNASCHEMDLSCLRSLGFLQVGCIHHKNPMKRSYSKNQASSSLPYTLHTQADGDQCYFFRLIWRPLFFFGLFRGHLTVPFRLREVILAGKLWARDATMTSKHRFYGCSMRSFHLVGDVGIVVFRNCTRERQTVPAEYTIIP